MVEWVFLSEKYGQKIKNKKIKPVQSIMMMEGLDF
jgi:hypothetical protein